MLSNISIIKRVLFNFESWLWFFYFLFQFFLFRRFGLSFKFLFMFISFWQFCRFRSIWINFEFCHILFSIFLIIFIDTIMNYFVILIVSFKRLILFLFIWFRLSNRWLNFFLNFLRLTSLVNTHWVLNYSFFWSWFIKERIIKCANFNFMTSFIFAMLEFSSCF